MVKVLVFQFICLGLGFAWYILGDQSTSAVWFAASIVISAITFSQEKNDKEKH